MSEPPNLVNIQFNISNYTGYDLELNPNTGVEDGQYDPFPPSALDMNASTSFAATGSGTMTGLVGYGGPWGLGVAFVVKFTVMAEGPLEANQIILDYNFPFTGGQINTSGQDGSFQVTINMGAVPQAK